MITFEIIDPILCKTNQPKSIKPFVQIKKEYWKKGIHHSEQKSYQKSMIENNGNFLLGYLTRICKALDERKISYEIKGATEVLKIVPVKIPLYNLRPYQKKLVEIACDVQRGVLVSPTATGKTIIMGHVAANLKSYRGLFLCHSISLVTQSFEEFKKMGLNPSLVYGKEKNFDGDIIVSSIQTLSNFPIEKICDLFDYILVDECHHVSSFSGTYYKLLTSILAPIRIGLTATLPKPESEGALALEGLIGPVIGEYTMEEALEEGMVAKPRIKLIAVPKNENLRELKTYRDIYKTGIVNNRMRNKLLARSLLEIKKEGKTALVYINQIEHIDNICLVLDNSLRYEIVKGEVENDNREKYKEALNNRELDFIIASNAWKEGINIPA
jgi:superfamily II DNA or RNA helicase